MTHKDLIREGPLQVNTCEICITINYYRTQEIHNIHSVTPVIGHYYSQGCVQCKEFQVYVWIKVHHCCYIHSNGQRQSLLISLVPRLLFFSTEVPQR